MVHDITATISTTCLDSNFIHPHILGRSLVLVLSSLHSSLRHEKGWGGESVGIGVSEHSDVREV